MFKFLSKAELIAALRAAEAEEQQPEAVVTYDDLIEDELAAVAKATGMEW